MVDIVANLERCTQTINDWDESARREIAFWKAQHDSMEKKHAEMALQKQIVLDEMKKLERERDKAVQEVEDGRRQLEEFERRVSRLEEDAALLMSAGTGVEERSGVAAANAADDLVVDGREGINGGDGSSEDNFTELPVKLSGRGAEKADKETGGGGTGPGPAGARTGLLGLAKEAEDVPVTHLIATNPSAV